VRSGQLHQPFHHGVYRTFKIADKWRHHGYFLCSPVSPLIDKLIEWRLGRRTQRINQEALMIETVLGIEVLQANPILDNAFGLRWVKSHQTQLGFEKRKESHRSDNRFPECISRFRRSLAIEMPTKSDASFCHSVLPDLPSGSFAPTGLQTPGYRCV
jgi:hypothetical protein